MFHSLSSSAASLSVNALGLKELPSEWRILTAVEGGISLCH